MLTRPAGYRVRTLSGKEIELDIESDYKARAPDISSPTATPRLNTS